MVLVVHEPYRQQSIIVLDIFHLYIVRSHHVRTVAADGFFHGLYGVFVDPLMDSGQDLS